MKGLRQVYQSKVKKERKLSLIGGWENVISGKQMDNVQEETLAVLDTGVIVDNKHNPAPNRLTEESLRKAVAPGEKVLQEGKVRRRA